MNKEGVEFFNTLSLLVQFESVGKTANHTKVVFKTRDLGLSNDQKLVFDEKDVSSTGEKTRKQSLNV